MGTEPTDSRSEQGPREEGLHEGGPWAATRPQQGEEQCLVVSSKQNLPCGLPSTALQPLHPCEFEQRHKTATSALFLREWQSWFFILLMCELGHELDPRP
jgi:hypothetical protein